MPNPLKKRDAPHRFHNPPKLGGHHLRNAHLNPVLQASTYPPHPNTILGSCRQSELGVWLRVDLANGPQTHLLYAGPGADLA